jgi:hypothetical protein
MKFRFSRDRNSRRDKRPLPLAQNPGANAVSATCKRSKGGCGHGAVQAEYKKIYP